MPLEKGNLAKVRNENWCKVLFEEPYNLVREYVYTIDDEKVLHIEGPGPRCEDGKNCCHCMNISGNYFFIHLEGTPNTDTFWLDHKYFTKISVG